ncbi:Helicase SKI2W [Hordeum vulgare]|nr:Helicase SKI2W [Hordeum vulgare]
MDDDLEAAAAINFMASFIAAAEATGKARPPARPPRDHGGEKARMWGKTNSKKEDRRDAASISLVEKVKAMISKKDMKEEKRRQEKEEQMHAFMEIQRMRLEMNAERQAKML